MFNSPVLCAPHFWPNSHYSSGGDVVVLKVLVKLFSYLLVLNLLSGAQCSVVVRVAQLSCFCSHYFIAVHLYNGGQDQ